GNETDPEFFESWNDFRFRLSPPQRVLALKCRDGLNRMSATNGIHTRFGKPEVLHLPLLNEVSYRSRNVFDRYAGIDAMLIEQIDHVSFKALERRIRHFLDVLRPAIHAAPARAAIGVRLEAELGGNDHLTTNRRQRFTNKFFVRERTVN